MCKDVHKMTRILRQKRAMKFETSHKQFAFCSCLEMKPDTFTSKSNCQEFDRI